MKTTDSSPFDRAHGPLLTNFSEEPDPTLYEETDAILSGPATLNEPSDASPPIDQVALFDQKEFVSMFSAGDCSANVHLQERNRLFLEILQASGPLRPFGLQSQVMQRLDALNVAMPHFDTVLDEVKDHVALAIRTRRPLFAPAFLLLGPPGIGKSFFCNRLADALGLPTYRLSMDNSQGSSELSGSATFWTNSETGIVFKALALGHHISPLILLDEIDKAPRHSQYDPLSSLHSLLEPSTAQYFQDSSYPLKLDARFVVWVATANTVDPLDRPLLSRFSVHSIAAPTRDQSRQIANAVAQDVLKQSGLSLELSPALLERLAERTPREQRQGMQRALGRAVRAGREVVLAEDLPAAPSKSSGRTMGFV